MVDSLDIPDEHHVARYCSRSRYDGDVVLPAAFQLKKPNEKYLSVNWLEYFGLSTTDEALSRICADKRTKGFSIRNTGCFAMLNAGFIRSISSDPSGLSDNSGFLTVIHLPENGDESHSGIGGFEDSGADLFLADVLAESISPKMLRKPPRP